MGLAQDILDAVAAHPNGLGYLFLGGSAALEYLFPPFPGDLVVVFGAFLVARRGWPGELVFGAVMLGSMLGFMGDYGLGRLLARAEVRWTGRLARARPRLDALVARFARHGAVYLAINRFLPSVRPFFFVAAGMARLSPVRVLLWGTVSAAAWNVVLFALGRTVGHNWERLRVIVETYGALMAALVLALAALVVARWWWRRRVTGR